MKLFSVLFGAISAGSPLGGSNDWPAADWHNTCGSRTELAMTSNSTCVVSVAKGKAGWVNSGGAFITTASTADANKFYIHTYDGHGEAQDRNGGVPFVVWYKIPYVWPNNLQGRIPPEWAAACGKKEDVSIECTDIGSLIEGVFMAPFNFAPGPSAAAGVKSIPLMNTAGHAKGTMYNFNIRNRKLEGVALKNIKVQANATVLATQDEDGNYGSTDGTFAVLLNDDYGGELLYTNFEHAGEDVKFFDAAQAHYSTVQ